MGSATDRRRRIRREGAQVAAARGGPRGGVCFPSWARLTIPAIGDAWPGAMGKAQREGQGGRPLRGTVPHRDDRDSFQGKTGRARRAAWLGAGGSLVVCGESRRPGSPKGSGRGPVSECVRRGEARRWGRRGSAMGGLSCPLAPRLSPRWMGDGADPRVPGTQLQVDPSRPAPAAPDRQNDNEINKRDRINNASGRETDETGSSHGRKAK